MKRIPIAVICGAAISASLSAVAALAGTSATQTASGSVLLTVNESISSQQPVVTGALGMPITTDIARNISAAATSSVQTAISTVSTIAVASTASAAAGLASQARLVAITPQSAVQRISTPNLVDGSVQQANFVITGDQDRSVSVAIPQAVPLSRVGGGDDLQFDTSSSLSPGSLGESRLTGVENGGGQLAFDVGGHVQMRPDLTAGAYAGILPVVVQYN